MRKNKAVLLTISVMLLLFCFCSCVSLSKKENEPFAYLTNTSRFILLPTGAIEKSMDMAQCISASYQDNNFLMIAWVKADETAVEMTLLNEMGTNIGELSYRGRTIAFSSQVFPDLIRPEYIIADFQLCFYDTSLLTQALKNCGLVMEINGTAKRILKGKELIYEIERNLEAIRLVNHLRRYTYTLEGDFS